MPLRVGRASFVAAVVQISGQRADIIGDLSDERCVRRYGINRERKAVGSRAGIARAVGGGDGQRMRTVTQRIRWGKTPVPPAPTVVVPIGKPSLRTVMVAPTSPLPLSAGRVSFVV